MTKNISLVQTHPLPRTQPGLRIFSLALLALLASWVSAEAVPTIVHQPPLDAKEGQPVPLNALVTDTTSSIVQVRLFYRSSGSLAYQLVIMNGTGYNYSGQIPGSAAQPAGVEYYLEASNAAGMTRTSPPISPTINPYHLLVNRAEPGPRLQLLSPENGSLLSAEEVVIVVSVDAGRSKPDLHSVVIILDEQEITRQAQLSLTLFSYVPQGNLSPGLHGLRVRVKNLEGVKSDSPTWSFTVRKPGAITPSPTLQPAGETKPAKIKFTGGISLDTQYATLLQEPLDTLYLSQPQGFQNRVKLDFSSRLEALEVLGSAYFTTEEKPGRQPVDRFRLEIFNQTLAMTLGDVYPIFSEYSLNNLWVRGGRLLLTSGRPALSFSQLQVIGGITRYPLEGRDFGAPGTFEQWLWASRWSYDFLPGTGFAINGLTLNDYDNSIQNPAGSQPANNLVGSAEAHVKIPLAANVSTSFYGEGGANYYDEAQNLMTISQGSAYRGGTKWEWLGRSFLQIEYKHTGANFVSLANPWLIGDWEGFSGNALMYFWNDSVALSAALDSWHDNLNGQKTQTYVDRAGTSVTAGTTQTLFCQGNINCRVASFLPVVSLGISLNRQQDNSQPVSVIDQQTQVINLGTGMQLPFGQDQALANLTYSLTTYHDLAQQKISADMNASSFLTSLLYLLKQAWSFSLGFGLTRNQMDSSGLASLSSTLAIASQSIDYVLWDAHLNWSVVPSRLELGGGWENLAGKDDAGRVDNSLTTFSLNSTYYFSSTHSLGLNWADIVYHDSLTAKLSYNELVCQLRYNIQF